MCPARVRACVRACLFECENEAIPFPPSALLPLLLDKCSLSALGGRFLSVSHQHSGQPDCLSAAGDVAGDELWCPVLFRNPPEPVCLQPPPLCTHTHKHTQTDKDTSHLIRRRSETTLVFFRLVSPSGAHTGVSAEYTNAFSLRVGSLRLCVRARVHVLLCVHARRSPKATSCFSVVRLHLLQQWTNICQVMGRPVSLPVCLTC